jgi:diguanylate cyclase (GGDEF)-like protein
MAEGELNPGSEIGGNSEPQADQKPDQTSIEQRANELQARIDALVAENQELKAQLEEEKRKRKEAEELSEIDPLTELLNRRGWQREIESRGYDYARHGDQCAVLMSDLDAFKQVNDTIGQDGGDQIIKLYAQALVEALREGDTVARIGGDEFYVFLRIGEEDKLPEIMQRIENQFISSLEQSEYWEKLKEAQDKTGKKYGVSIGSHHIDWNEKSSSVSENIAKDQIGTILNNAMIEANKKEKLVKEIKGAAR